MKEERILLRELLEDKKNYLREIFLVCKEQGQAINDEEVERLEELLEQKDSFIEKINLLDAKILEIKDGQSMADEEVVEILGDINETLSQIKCLDDENNKNLQVSIDEMKGNLKDIRQGKRVVNKYGDSDPYQAFTNQGGTFFIDQDS